MRINDLKSDKKASLQRFKLKSKPVLKIPRLAYVNLERVGTQIELGAHETPHVEHGASSNPDPRVVRLPRLVASYPCWAPTRPDRIEGRQVKQVEGMVWGGESEDSLGVTH